MCSGFDDDCDGFIDESDAVGALVWYYDWDADGYGDISVTQLACTQPNSYVSDSSDCNDNLASTYPGATEVCNGVDDNCDGFTDQGLAGSDALCAASDCSQIKSQLPASSDGIYWITENGVAVQAYCDMNLESVLCSENEQERFGQTRDATQLDYKMMSVLDPSNGTCAIWAVRSTVTNTPLGHASFGSMSSCQTLGFVANHQANSCSYGSLYGTCGFYS